MGKELVTRRWYIGADEGGWGEGLETDLVFVKSDGRGRHEVEVR